jgi:hypothetical protein
LVIARDDFVAERLLPAELKAWAPVASLIAMRPRYTRPVKLFEVMSALGARATGDYAPWSELVAGMRAHGIMGDRDRDFPQWHA